MTTVFWRRSVAAGGAVLLLILAPTLSGETKEAPRIAFTFGKGIFTEGESRTLGVSADGSEPLSYRWFMDGEELTDETEANLHFSALVPSDTANYQVEVSNAYGESRSPLIPLLVFSSNPSGGQRDGSLFGKVDGTVYALAEEADGSVLVAGAFDSYRGLSRRNLFRITPDDGVDPDFRPGALLPGTVTAMAVQPDQQILVAGAGWIMRLDREGKVDPDFFNGGLRANSQIRSLGVQPCGGILVAGRFDSFDGSYTGPLVQLWPDGAFRQSLGRCTDEDPTRSCEVEQLLVQPDGTFVTLTRIAFDFRPTRFVDRHMADGSVDESFSYSPVTPFGPRGVLPHIENGPVAGYWLLDADDTLIQRLTLNGDRDASFSGLALRGAVHQLARGSGGRLYIDADFWETGEEGPFRIASDGSFDTDFRSREDFEGLSTRVMLEHSSGDLWMAGNFSHGPNPLRLTGGEAVDTEEYSEWGKVHGVGPAGDDFGGYGIPNLMRFALGLDPHNPERKRLPAISREECVFEGSSAEFLTLTYRRSVKANGLRFSVQGSSDLADWQPLTHQLRREIDPADPSIERITIRDETPADRARRFLRLQVEIVGE